MVRAGETRWELIMGILDSPRVKGMFLGATVSIGRWFLIGGTGRRVFHCRGRYTDVRPLGSALEVSCTRWVEREGNEGSRCAVARFTSGGEHITLIAAILCRWEIRRGTGGRQDSNARIPVGVAERQFVVHLWTLCRKVLRRAEAPALGVKRSAPYSRMGAINDVASLWHRHGARPAPGRLRCLMNAKAPCARAKRCEKWAEESSVGVNQYPSHRTQSRGAKQLPFDLNWGGAFRGMPLAWGPPVY